MTQMTSSSHRHQILVEKNGSSTTLLQCWLLQWHEGLTNACVCQLVETTAAATAVLQVHAFVHVAAIAYFIAKALN